MTGRRALLSSLRGERELLPRLRVFIPLFLRRSPRHRVGPQAELTARAAHLSSGAVVLQLQPVRAGETVALAAGCREGGATLRVHWPPDASHAAFAEWHRAVIGSGLLPYVEIVSEADPAAPDVGFVQRPA
jgi:hypothetical protein